jgi:predicted esterase
MDGVAFFAPAAQDRTWYPERFLVPRQRNEPYLSSALQAISDVVAMITAAGIAADRIMLVGFSQGACLSLEFAARHSRRYGGVAALSGGLIGADDELTGYVGSLKGTPILMGCSDRDSHIPVERIDTSAEILQGLGAAVDVRIYPGMGHTINQDEVDQMRGMLTALMGDQA